MNLKSFQQHLNQNLAWYVAAALGLGLLLGDLSGAFLDRYGSSLSNATTVVVFFMIYPMMVNLQVEALGKAMRNWRALLLSLAYNFLWAPILGFLLSKVFLPDPMLAFGFMLVMVVPCSSMKPKASIGYTGLVKGNLELATVVVAASFVAAIPVLLGVILLAAGVSQLTRWANSTRSFEPLLRRAAGVVLMGAGLYSTWAGLSPMVFV